MVRSSSAINPGTATVAPTRVQPLLAQQSSHLLGERGQRPLDPAHVGDRTGDPVSHGTRQIEDDRGDVLHVGLEADADVSATGEGEPEARAAAIPAAHLLVGADRAGQLQVADDRTDRGLGEPGAAGELRPGRGSVLTQ